MRAVDVILSFPQLVFALLLLSLLGPRLWLIMIAVGARTRPRWPACCGRPRSTSPNGTSSRRRELQGLRPATVMGKEILPSLVSPLMVEAGLRLTYSIVIMAGLAFLGFGQPPPAANWGTMINENRDGLSLNPWAVIVPAVLIAPADDRDEHVHRRVRPGWRSAWTARPRRRRWSRTSAWPRAGHGDGARQAGRGPRDRSAGPAPAAPPGRPRPGDPVRSRRAAVVSGVSFADRAGRGARPGRRVGLGEDHGGPGPARPHPARAGRQPRRGLPGRDGPARG